MRSGTRSIPLAVGMLVCEPADRSPAYAGLSLSFLVFSRYRIVASWSLLMVGVLCPLCRPWPAPDDPSL